MINISYLSYISDDPTDLNEVERKYMRMLTKNRPKGVSKKTPTQMKTTNFLHRAKTLKRKEKVSYKYIDKKLYM